MAGPDWSRTPIWRAPIPRSTPHVGHDKEGLRRLFRQFSFPGGIPSHVAPETPGSIHEGGELGYALVHAYGAIYDNPDLIACCVVGDGEAETGPLAASWHSNKFVNPARDGAVLPILHLNGYKIANPTLLARIDRGELRALLEGYGHRPYFVEGDEPDSMHQLMAETLDEAVGEIRRVQAEARDGGTPQRPRWPMIVLITPKGWTGPKEVDGKPAEGTFRSHQVPLANLAENPEHLEQLEAWLRSYEPQNLFGDDGALAPELLELAPSGERRMGANPHANGGLLTKALDLPDFRDYAVDVPSPAKSSSEACRCLGNMLRDVIRRNDNRFRLFGPDETASNRLGAVFEVTDRQWLAERKPTDDHLAAEGRVMEVLSEHLCQGWLEGYLLTGRHGLFNCYEAFIHIVDSMFNQHAKWLKVTRGHPVAAADPFAELPAELPRLAPGPQRLLASGPGVHRPRGEQAGRDHPRLPAPGRQLPPVCGRPLPSQLRLRERDRRRQAALARLPTDGRGDRALHARAGDLGVGVDRRRRRAGRRARVRRGHPHPGDGRGRCPAARAPARPQGAGRQRRGPDAPPTAARSTRMGCPTPSSTRSSPPTGR